MGGIVSTMRLPHTFASVHNSYQATISQFKSHSKFDIKKPLMKKLLPNWPLRPSPSAPSVG